MAYIGGFLQSKEEEEKLKATFRELDRNGDGTLEKDELIKGYVRTGVGRKEATKIVNNLLAIADVNKDGRISYSEYLMANMRVNDSLSEEKLRSAFKMIDKVWTQSAKKNM